MPPFPSLHAFAKPFCSWARAGRRRRRELSQLNFLLGEVFADAALAACRKFRVRPSQIALIGSHGQTVFHQGAPARFCGRRVASTLQIGEPSVIAARTGITTVGDFRPADMAAGGQGAPLVPFVDYLLYRNARVGRAALNIGGIANVTVIPRSAKIKDVFAFDTGPGNMVIDALVRHFTHGRKSFDRNAEMAARGKLLPRLLDQLLRDKYFLKPPPKTAGREQYGENYLRRVLAHREARRARPQDVIRTATILTALSIVDAFHRYVLPRTKVGETDHFRRRRAQSLACRPTGGGIAGHSPPNIRRTRRAGRRQGSVCICIARLGDAAPASSECARGNGGEEGGRAGQGVLCSVRREDGGGRGSRGSSNLRSAPCCGALSSFTSFASSISFTSLCRLSLHSPPARARSTLNLVSSIF